MYLYFIIKSTLNEFSYNMYLWSAKLLDTTVSPVEAAVQYTELQVDHSGMLQTTN